MMRERDDNSHNPTPSPVIAWGDFLLNFIFMVTLSPPHLHGGGFPFFFFLSFTPCCLPPAFCIGVVYFSLSNIVTLSPLH